ncbi:hypothetical protein [Nocardioides flavescens]|uniref:SurA N-terminal domain-containing protein n=1 Tax=Nocardioides flavescens TaxID=2691959 RepID=A0A6L7EXS4_9ACTN|nr:hypothetical protein [Nocardioides flavescens]MXG90328.1 hypothetical protein [Nocardioides flavescens]
MRHARLLPVLALTGVTLLSGCGVAGTQFSPGVAAKVGDVRITEHQVEQVTDGYCGAIEAVSAEQGGTQSVPLRYLTHEFTTTLVIKAAAEQLAEQYDVQAGDSYRQALAQLEPQVASLSRAQRDAVLEIEGGQAYYQDVLTQIGAIEAGDDEGDDADNGATDGAAAAGQAVLDDWFEKNDVEVNPKYAFEYGTAGQADTDTSVAVSSAATGGLAAQPSESYAASLPQHMVCGGTEG